MNKTQKEVPFERMLTYQELQVLKLLIDGKAIPVISEISGMSELRIGVLKNVMFRKFGFNNLLSLLENVKEENALI